MVGNTHSLQCKGVVYTCLVAPVTKGLTKHRQASPIEVRIIPKWVISACV